VAAAEFSASGAHFARIEPGPGARGGAAGELPEAGSGTARAEFYARAKDRSYRLTWEAALPFALAPDKFLVTDRGYLIAMDDWCERGQRTAIVVIGPQGKTTRTYRLSDLFSREESAAFPASVSSIRWRESAYVRMDQETVYIHVTGHGGLMLYLAGGCYKFCEYQGEVYRCRSSNEDREWLSNQEISERLAKAGCGIPD
jgi:hypothetical protein